MSIKSEARTKMLSLMTEGWEEDEQLSKQILALGEIIWDQTGKYKEELKSFNIGELSLKKLVLLKEQGYTDKEIYIACKVHNAEYRKNINILKDYHKIGTKKYITEHFDYHIYPEADKTIKEILSEGEVKMEENKVDIELYVDEYLETKNNLKESTLSGYRTNLRKWLPIVSKWYDFSTPTVSEWHDFSLPIPVRFVGKKMRGQGAVQSEISVVTNFLKWLDKQAERKGDIAIETQGIDARWTEAPKDVSTQEEVQSLVTDVLEALKDEPTTEEPLHVYVKDDNYFIFYKDGDYVITDELAYAVENTTDRPDIETKFGAVKTKVRATYQVVYELESEES